MNETVEISTEKTSEDEELERVERKKDSRYVKRDREDSTERCSVELSQKIRKKTSQLDVHVELKRKGPTDRTAMTEIAQSDGGGEVETGEKKNDPFDIQNDSVLLNDLLQDFCADFPALNVAASSSQKNTDGDEPTTQRSCASTRVLEDEGPNREHADSTGSLLETEFDGEFDDSFDEDFNDDFNDETRAVDLEKFRRCKIVKIERERRYTKITIEDPVKNATATVLCYGFWKDTMIEINDIVSVKAKKNSDDWIIDNENGFIVTQPHTLISGTSVVGAHFCIRRGVLVERFRGLDSLPNLETNDCGMTIGVLVHEVLQKVLFKKISSIREIRKITDDTIGSRRGTRMLYEANISLNDCKRQMESYVPKIVKFLQRYVTDDAGRINDNNFNGKIERIREIEENIWLPELGLKGKVDVTVDATVNLDRKIMPLEVKTGRPSFSSEHRGQLILYSMMLSFLGQKVDTGLLLYISENIMQEVKNNHPEERDLIILRNNFANYVAKVPKFESVEKDNGSVEKIWKPMELPEPINHRMACVKCPYKTICSIYAVNDKFLELSESHVLRGIAKEAMTYLKQEHIDYVMNWITMLRLEDSVPHDLTTLRDIWMLEPREREKKGTCICNLEVCGDVVEEGNKYLHTFVRKDQDEEHTLMDLSLAHFTEVDYIIVSTNTRINVSAGHLKRKSKHGIELLLERDVVRQNPMATFHLDRYPFASLSSRSLANVACLLNDNEITNKLRSIVIEKKPTSFVEKLPKTVVELGAPLLFQLNKYQRKAILSVLSANDYLLIKGMPGTGKTQTLVALIELLVKMEKSVLITAHTHSAVDNILLKLNDRGIDFLRLGSDSRINPALMHKSEQVVTGDCKTPESLKAVYSSKKVVAVTCFGAIHGLVANRIFDVCLVDESTQVLQPTLLRPIYSASKFVLVGDPQQLPPVIHNNEARKMGMDESLFTRLDSDNNTITLKLQYRMNRKIMSIANDLTYEGFLKAGNSEVADATLRIKNTMVLESCERWVSKALSLNIEDSVIMLNTGETHALNAKCDLAKCNEDVKHVRNIFEAAIILRLVGVLRKGGVDATSIGIICPFRAQVELLRNVSEDIEVNTVDQYQGRDKDVIFYSCTRSTPATFKEPREYEILQDFQRLNVAMTRAKHKLIIIGDKLTLKRFKPFEKLFSVLENDIVDLKPGRDDFSWESLVQLIK